MDPLKVFYLDHLQSLCAHAETPTSLVDGKSLESMLILCVTICLKGNTLMGSNKQIVVLCLESV